ncbi:hypothetical protein GCM10010430_59490 [Kitasatospora cystarginea]|uniref:Uncharacterized protein n=1 Tax=Kitasatospora cystarginea TaxID=58350 RepID=A0ABP5RMV6_9ACTN
MTTLTGSGRFGGFPHLIGRGPSDLRLNLRGGHGLGKFYGRCGYLEIGRAPRTIRVAPGDERDEVTMWLDLR